MTEPDENTLVARTACANLTYPEAAANYLRGKHDFYHPMKVAKESARLAREASAAKIKALEEEIAAMQEITGNLRVEMSDMLTRLHELHPEDFVWLKEADQ